MEEYSLWSRLVHQFKRSCSDFDGLWIKRKRKFDTLLLVTGILKLVGGSQSQDHQVLDGLGFGLDKAIAASSFSEARAKFPAFLIGELRQNILSEIDDQMACEAWHGYQVYAVDGTKISLPRPLFAEGFKAPSSGFCPQGLVSTLLRVNDRMICDIKLSAKENEREEALEHLAVLGQNDLVVYDRGYLSFALLTAHVHQGIGAIFRAPKGKSFLPIQHFWKSKDIDKIVTINPTEPTYRSTKRQYPDHALKPIKIRLIKYFIDKRPYVLATTILEKSLQIKDFKKLYAKRWRSEEIYKGLKQTLELEAFHSKSLNCVEQEIEASALFWNLSMVFAKISCLKLKKRFMQAIKLISGSVRSNFLKKLLSCYVRLVQSSTNFLGSWSFISKKQC